MIRACGGLPLLHLQLSSPVYQLRRIAAFCLGNLVRDNMRNAREVVIFGGVELLLCCVTDEEEDELSKTVRITLGWLGAIERRRSWRVVGYHAVVCALAYVRGVALRQ